MITMTFGQSRNQDIHQLFEELLQLLLLTRAADRLDVLSLFGVINLDYLVVPDALRRLLKCTTYSKKYGYLAVEKLILEQAIAFYQTLPTSVTENAVSYAARHKLLLFSLSTRQISPANPHACLDMPGNLWHQDGKGVALATKITMLTKRQVATGGELCITSDVMKIGQAPDPTSCHKLALSQYETINFDNRRLVHAVNAQFQGADPKAIIFRTLLQERLNNIDELHPRIFEEIGCQLILRKEPTLFSLMLTCYRNFLANSKSQRTSRGSPR